MPTHTTGPISKRFTVTVVVLTELTLLQAALLEKVKKGELNKEYLPMSGYAAFKEETTKLILGKSARSIAEKRVAVIQSLSGTGALRTGGIFIQRFMAGRTIFLPTPTWGNHNAIFKNAGVPIKQYRYINKQMGLDFDGMIADLKVTYTPTLQLLVSRATRNIAPPPR